jgi:hypothetical protein
MRAALRRAFPDFVRPAVGKCKDRWNKGVYVIVLSITRPSKMAGQGGNDWQTASDDAASWHQGAALMARNSPRSGGAFSL